MSCGPKLLIPTRWPQAALDIQQVATACEIAACHRSPRLKPELLKPDLLKPLVFKFPMAEVPMLKSLALAASDMYASTRGLK